jgi:hypothetical protein
MAVRVAGLTLVAISFGVLALALGVKDLQWLKVWGVTVPLLIVVGIVGDLLGMPDGPG